MSEMYRGHRINRNPSSHRQNGAFSIALTCNAIDLSRAIDGWLSSIVLELFSHLFLGIEMVMWGNLAGQFRLDLSDAVQLALCLLVEFILLFVIIIIFCLCLCLFLLDAIILYRVMREPIDTRPSREVPTRRVISK